MKKEVDFNIFKVQILEEIKVTTPRDRAASFDPQFIKKRETLLSWTMPVPNWGIISQQLAIKFENRYNLL